MIRSAARCLQYALFAIGFVILGYCGASWMNSRVQQARGNRELDRVLAYKPSVRGVPAPQHHILDGGLIGKVEISRLHLSAVVFQGTDASVLDHGVGHLNGSPLPGQAGNVVLAAHRDTFFRSLKDIQKGDVVSVSTEFGARTYKVESTEVVPPDQTSVLDATDTPTLTLITCYPFYYVGHAPKRFIVRARDMQALVARPAEPPQLVAQAPPKKEPARIALPVEPRRRPEDIENLTYVFRASQ
jgi:sortase A